MRILKFLESVKTPFISFIYDNNEVIISEETPTKVYTSLLDWLYKNGYTFKGELHTPKVRKVYTLNDAKNSEVDFSRFHNIKGSSLYMAKSGQPGNVEVKLDSMIKMLNNFNVDTSTVRSSGFSKIIEDPKGLSDKMTFIKAAQIILQENNNIPMSASEIWSEIFKNEMVESYGKTPIATLNANLMMYSPNSNVKKKYKTSIFEMVSNNPVKFKLLKPSEVQDVPDFEETEIETDDSEVLTPSDFIKNTEKPKVYVINPFRQAICILGESGAGKSTTIENILEHEKHEYEFIVPSASTTGLLSQFSPIKNSYIQSRLGKMIMNAYNNPSKLYTSVIDEFHKSNIIEMVNDEIMHAISTKRYGGKRFISLDTDTEELYPNSTKWRGNILIPDNLGFIFISSKPKVISNNPDFFNRLDIVILKHHEEEKIESSDELISKILPEEEKIKLVSARND